MSYDPAAHGADCTRCILREANTGRPVPSELKLGARAVVVGEAPGDFEVREGRPFVGPSGRELTLGLEAVGIARSELAFVNCLSCQPPGNDLEATLHRWRRENKARDRAGREPLPSPLECCRPRMLAEILSVSRSRIDNRGRAEGADAADIIAVGKSALAAVTGISGSILELRGGPITGTFDARGRFVRAAAGNVCVLPTLHPAFVLRARRWTRAFRADLARAFRWFSGRLEWKDPTAILAPSLAQVEAWFAAHSRGPVAYDTETSLDDPLRSRLLCVGFGTEEDVLVVPWDSIERDGNFWPEHERGRVADRLKRFFLDRAITKVGHNSNYFDRMVIEHHFGVRPAPVLDTIMLHRCVELELPHKLAYVGSVYTDVTAWKAANTATEAKTDRELHAYCGVDAVVTARILPQLIKACELRRQTEQARFSHFVQSWCVGLHENGMYVDTAARDAHDARLRVDAREWLEKVRVAAGDADFNPASAPQVRELLFGKWKLPPINHTKLGEPSTDDETLRTFRLDRTLPADRLAFFEALRRFRRATKLHGTYVAKLRVPGCAGSALSTSDEAADAAGTAENPDGAAVGILWPDGRVRADWNAHGTKGWRLSSSNPNCQNWPRSLRDMATAAPGRLLVGADMDQLELRFAAALAGASRYLEVFAAGGDPHAVSAEMLWGAKFVAAAPADRKRMRDFAKRFTYACFPTGTGVAVLDARGAIPIEQIRPGDWTWCWNGTAYAPTRVREVRCHGVRSCVRVTFAWRGPEGEKRSTVECTADHLFLLRDGTCTPAGVLAPGARLMPFRRWRNGPYRVIDPFNDGARVPEHRAAVGILAHDDGRIVHHGSGGKRDNRPANLMIEPSNAAHVQRHWREDDGRRRMALAVRNAAQWTAGRRTETNARLAGGRRGSARWRAAARKNLAAARVALAKARVEDRVHRKPQASLLDAFRDRIGVLRDAEVARLAGCTPENVRIYRVKRGIAPPPGQRRNHVVVSVEPAGEHEVWDLEVDHPAHNFALAAGIFVHNCLYRAEPETVHDVIVSVENEKGELVYAGMSRQETALLHNKWLDACPQFRTWWERDADEWRTKGFLVDPVLGLRCDFLDGEDLNALSNFKAQCGGSALVHLGTRDFLERVPFGYAGPGTGLVNQCHDSLTVEVPGFHPKWRPDEKDAERQYGWCEPGCRCEASRVAGILQECMTRRVPGLDVPFTAGAKIGLKWSET